MQCLVVVKLCTHTQSSPRVSVTYLNVSNRPDDGAIASRSTPMGRHPGLAGICPPRSALLDNNVINWTVQISLVLS